MPRKKKEPPKASVRHSFDDGECLIRSVGEVMASRIEQAAKLLAMGRESGDSASMEAARKMRLKAVKEIDEWAGSVIKKIDDGEKAANKKRLERQRGIGKPLKQTKALTEIERLVKMGKEPKAIPGMLEKSGICSARYARSLLKKVTSRKAEGTVVPPLS